MKRTLIIFVLILCTFISCRQSEEKKEPVISDNSEFTKIIKEDYELYIPQEEIKAVLILFGGYPEVAEDIKRET